MVNDIIQISYENRLSEYQIKLPEDTKIEKIEIKNIELVDKMYSKVDVNDKIFHQVEGIFDNYVVLE